MAARRDVARREERRAGASKTPLADEAIRDDDRPAAHRGGPPEPLHVHPGALRRVQPLAEGRRPVHRGPPRRGGLPDGRGARAPRQHVELDRRALLAGARVRGLSRAPGLGPRGVPAQARRPRRARRRGDAALLARPEPVRDGARRRPRQRGGDRAQGVALRRRGRDQDGRERREDPHRRHGPDGVLRLLPPAPADAARPAGRGRGQPVAGGPRPARAHRRRDARASACRPVARTRS